MRFIDSVYLVLAIAMLIFGVIAGSKGYSNTNSDNGVIVPESVQQLDWLVSTGYNCKRDGGRYLCQK